MFSPVSLTKNRPSKQNEKSMKSFAIVSDYFSHDSSHGCLALKKVNEWVDGNLPVYFKVTYVSDGAASHFKNRYQLFEFKKSNCLNNPMDILSNRTREEPMRRSWRTHQASSNAWQLEKNPESAIQAARDFVTILSEKLKDVHLIHLEEKEVVPFRKLKEEWMRVPAFYGIQSWHAW